MRNCFIPKCDNLCKDRPRRMMFMAPKDPKLFEIWKDILPKKREFKHIDKVCERHFTKDDILTTFDHIINGELLQMERGRPRLKPTAVPSLNLEVSPEELKTPAGIKRKNSSRKIRKEKEFSSDDQELIQETSSENAKSKKDGADAVATSPVDKTDKNEEANNHSSVMEISLDQFEMLYDEVFEVTLPSMLWGIHRENDRNFIAFTYFDIEQMQSTKSVVLHCNGRLKIALNGNVVSEQSLSEQINPASLSHILNQVDEARFCVHWNESKHCDLLVPEDSDVCITCMAEEN